jgi:hypothetical protein
MTWSQTFVVAWLQCALASAGMFWLARLAWRRIPQPADRQRLTQLTLDGAAAVPLLIALAPWPGWHWEVVTPVQFPVNKAWKEPVRIGTANASDRLNVDHHFDSPLAKDRTRYSLPAVFLPRKITLKAGSETVAVEIQAVPHHVVHLQNRESSGKPSRELSTCSVANSAEKRGLPSRSRIERERSL